MRGEREAQTMKDWKKELCPKCGRRGLHYADHPHARGFKDYDRLNCRFCKSGFRIKEKSNQESEC